MKLLPIALLLGGGYFYWQLTQKDKTPDIETLFAKYKAQLRQYKDDLARFGDSPENREYFEDRIAATKRTLKKLKAQLES